MSVTPRPSPGDRVQSLEQDSKQEAKLLVTTSPQGLCRISAFQSVPTTHPTPASPYAELISKHLFKMVASMSFFSL